MQNNEQKIKFTKKLQVISYSHLRLSVKAMS